jgi:hypothetical protein
MKLPFRLCLLMLLCLSTFAVATVTVSKPSNGATVGSPVNYVANSSSSCSKGVASMGVYVDNGLVHVSNGNSLNASVSMSAGKHHTVVQEWDYCGGSTFTAIDLSVSSSAGVWVSSPSNGATVSSPVSYQATATTGSCAKGVASMGVYVNSKLAYVQQGASLKTNVSLSPGSYDTVVEEWDYCGGASFKHVGITVSGTNNNSGKAFNQVQAMDGWIGYGEYPPKYDICTKCGGGVTWSKQNNVGSPSLSGNATKFTIGGTHPYADVLWTKSLTQAIQARGDAIADIHGMTYDLYFFGYNLELSQVLEFDLNQYFGGKGFTWGHQCRIAGGHEWDVWDNVNSKWIPTGVPCHPNSNAWNHLTLQVERTPDNKLRYHSITLNGKTAVLDHYYPPFNVGKWFGISMNFQMDGNSNQTPYSVYLDKFTVTYW